MSLADYITDNDISFLNNKLRNLSILSLAVILRENYMDLGLDNENDIEYLSFKESLSLVLTGNYTEPVFEMRLNIYKNDIFLGYYQYLCKLDFTYVDEFFVVR